MVRTPPSARRAEAGPARPRAARLVGSIVLAVAIGACGGDGSGDRQEAVARRGAEVMPFDLAATTHRFTKTTDGGVQAVTADDPGDRDQIQLIREHLADERDRFAAGDFDDPAAIHGMDMPGVAELRRGYRQITVELGIIESGAELRYATREATLIDAIHAWFDRQVMDHGDDAVAG